MEMVEHVVKWVLALESENVVGYVLLSSIYAIVGKRHLCENVEQHRKE